jgi:sec-independent protein translocase protein TatA
MLSQTAGQVPLFIPVGPELLIILAVLILLFGANRIPKLARAVGQSLSEFQRGRQESTQNDEPTDVTADDFEFNNN